MPSDKPTDPEPEVEPQVRARQLQAAMKQATREGDTERLAALERELAELLERVEEPR